MLRGSSQFVLASLFFFSLQSHSEDLDKVLSEAKEALKNPVASDSPAPQNSKSVRHMKKIKPVEAAVSPEESNSTASLPSTEARQVLNIDIRALAHEQEPQDPRFTTYFSAGIYNASPSFTMYKDDDSFTLRSPAQLTGGSLALDTSWSIGHIFKDKVAMKAILQGAGGIYTGTAQVARRGVDNSNPSYEYYIVPISLGAGLGFELSRTYALNLTYGPSLHLVNQKGTGEDDTLSGAFSSDQFDLGLGAQFLKGWEAQLNFIYNGLLNQNVKGEGFLIGLGYRISG